jgi:protein SCO1/2
MKNANLSLRLIHLVLSLLVIAGCASGPSFRSTLIEPSTSAPEIGLADQSGTIFRLSDWQGRLVVLFFGFTNCPDVCPLTAAHLKQALELMGESAQRVGVVMVTTDPVRDTSQAIDDYLGKFNPGFIGIPGTEESLSKVWTDYGVTVMHGGETHSSVIYVVDQAGNLRLSFTPQTSPEDIAYDLQTLLAQE